MEVWKGRLSRAFNNLEYDSQRSRQVMDPISPQRRGREGGRERGRTGIAAKEGGR